MNESPENQSELVARIEKVLGSQCIAGAAWRRDVAIEILSALSLPAATDDKKSDLVHDMTGAGLIARERARQVSDEGWTPEHDDGHTDGMLRVMAAILACEGTDAYVEDLRMDEPWKIGKKGRVPRLVIAGALIAAEIDRLNRKDSALSSRKPNPTKPAPATSESDLQPVSFEEVSMELAAANEKIRELLTREATLGAEVGDLKKERDEYARSSRAGLHVRIDVQHELNEADISSDTQAEGVAMLRAKLTAAEEDARRYERKVVELQARPSPSPVSSALDPQEVGKVREAVAKILRQSFSLNVKHDDVVVDRILKFLTPTPARVADATGDWMVKAIREEVSNLAACDILCTRDIERVEKKLLATLAKHAPATPSAPLTEKQPTDTDTPTWMQAWLNEPDLEGLPQRQAFRRGWFAARKEKTT